MFPVIEKIYLWFVILLSMVSLIGIYLGIMKLIIVSVVVIVFVVAILLSFFLVREYHGYEIKQIKHANILYGILALFGLILLYPMAFSMIFPSACSDMQFGALATRTIAYNHGFVASFYVLYDYHNMTNALPAMIYLFYGNSYQIHSVIGWFLEIMVVFSIFIVAKEFFSEKVAILSTFIAAFSIVNIWIMDQGYIPQLFGTVFFMSSIYLYMKKSKVLLFFSNIGLFSYPHFFIIYMLFLFLESWRGRNFKSNFLIPLLSIVVLLPHILGIVSNFTLDIELKNILLTKGGILVPPIIAFLVYTFAVYGLYLLVKQRNISFLNIIFAVFSLLFFIAFVFGLNYFLKFTIISFYQLYFIVKILYLALIPLSIVAAVGISNMLGKKNRRYSILIIMALIIHFMYFLSYSFIDRERGNFKPEMYDAMEVLNHLPGEFNIGFDECLMDNKWVQKFPYNSLIDAEKEYVRCSREEAYTISRFNWVKPDGPVVNSRNESIVSFGIDDADYFVTDCRVLDKPLFYDKNGFRVYVLR